MAALGCSSHASRAGTVSTVATASAQPIAVPSASPAPPVPDAASGAQPDGGVDRAGEEARAAATRTAEQEGAIRQRFEGDPRAAAAALDLFARTGDVATVIVEQDMEGGWRGNLHLVPQVPAGKYEPHLEWVRAGLYEHDGFFAALVQEAPHPVRYRWRPLELRFFRSVGQHRPSAYAEDWSVAYNVEGSLNLDASAVRELLFHEIFHLNDDAHHDWSVVSLKELYAGLVARCGTRVDCLTPFAPTSTRVRAGTFYAFQPNNGEGVHEYAAELAVRYYQEQRARAAGATVKHPFKCGPEQNARAWKLLVDEFFGGLDRVPPCP